MLDESRKSMQSAFALHGSLYSENMSEDRALLFHTVNNQQIGHVHETTSLVQVTYHHARHFLRKTVSFLSDVALVKGRGAACRLL